MAILKIRDENGNIQEIAALRGEPGKKGDAGENILLRVEDVAPYTDAEGAAALGIQLAANVEYRCFGAVEKLEIYGLDFGVSGYSNMWSIVFTAGDSITVTMPASILWAVAEPVFEAGHSYWLSFVEFVGSFGTTFLGVWSEV